MLNLANKRRRLCIGKINTARYVFVSRYVQTNNKYQNTLPKYTYLCCSIIRFEFPNLIRMITVYKALLKSMSQNNINVFREETSILHKK